MRAFVLSAALALASLTFLPGVDAHHCDAKPLTGEASCVVNYHLDDTVAGARSTGASSGEVVTCLFTSGYNCQNELYFGKLCSEDHTVQYNMYGLGCGGL